MVEWHPAFAIIAYINIWIIPVFQKPFAARLGSAIIFDGVTYWSWCSS